MNFEDIPALIRRIRERAGWTQERLAREIGVAFSTVNNWEGGKRRPQPYLLQRLREIEADVCSDDATSR